MENEQREIPASEAFNAIVDAMGALVDVFCRHLPASARSDVAAELQQLAIQAQKDGREASAMLLNDLRSAANTHATAAKH